MRLFPSIAILLAALLLFSCTGKRLIKKNPNRQHFVDISGKYLPKIPGTVRHVLFSWVNRDAYRDLVVHVVDEKGQSRIFPLINRDNEGFVFNPAGRSLDSERGRIGFLATGDLNGDRAEDLVHLIEGGRTGAAEVWLNNKKGYYYKKVDQVLPLSPAGMERVDLVDVDGDRDLDLFFTGRQVKNPAGEPHSYQIQIWINDGKGEFQDHTALLLPRVPPGVSGSAFADYDGDGVVDLFLLYGNGQNRLLLNNGLGKFADRTRGSLPVLKDESVHSDWADFDGDGDNDLLVVNRSIARDFRAHATETCYFLVNDGRGRFDKRSHKALPREPAHRVYLLDANGNGIPDALILSESGTHYLQGRGKWKFSEETERRLPRSRNFTEMSFGDLNDDTYLDVAGVHPEKKTALLWLNRFK